MHRYPNDGVVPFTPLFDQVGPHARDVGDLALFDQVITGEPVAAARGSLAGVRLGLSRAYFFDALDPEVERVTNDALAMLEEAGAILVEAEVPDLERLIGLTTAQVQLFDVRPRLEEYLEQYEAGVTFDEVLASASKDIQHTFALYVLPGGRHVIAERDFLAARDVHLPVLRQTMRDYFADNNVDALCFPMAQIVATPIGEDVEVDIAGKKVGFEAAISRNISPGSTAGLPGLVLPAGLTTEGLPVGIELDGPEGSDRDLLGIGFAVERVLGRPPPPAIRSQTASGR